jgi:uncharacterized membrane protein
MNTKYMFIVAAMAVMLIGATALATEDAFADGKKKYGTSQAYSQNDCGNGSLAMYVVCQNTGLQVDGDKNAVALDSSYQQGEDYRKDKKDWDHDSGYGGNGGSSGTATQDNSGGTNNANGGSGTATQDNSGGTNSGQNDGSANDNVNTNS